MIAVALPNGNLLVPIRAELDDGTVGDGMVEVEPGTAQYELWAPWATPVRAQP